MSDAVAFTGLDDLMAQLRALPAELVAEANVIVAAAAQKTEAEASAAYMGEATPVPELADGLVTKGNADAFGASWRVTNKDYRSGWYEFGTATRQTSLGYNRGAEPAHPTLVPIAMRNRAAMYAQLWALVERAGLELSGSLP